jgi:hypothetical protein
MNKQDFLHLYGKTVYEVRLDLAIRLWHVLSPEGNATADYCLENADRFVDGLLKEDDEILKDRWK